MKRRQQDRIYAKLSRGRPNLTWRERDWLLATAASPAHKWLIWLSASGILLPWQRRFFWGNGRRPKGMLRGVIHVDREATPCT